MTTTKLPTQEFVSANGVNGLVYDNLIEAIILNVIANTAEKYNLYPQTATNIEQRLRIFVRRVIHTNNRTLAIVDDSKNDKQVWSDSDMVYTPYETLVDILASTKNAWYEDAMPSGGFCWHEEDGWRCIELRNNKKETDVDALPKANAPVDMTVKDTVPAEGLEEEVDW